MPQSTEVVFSLSSIWSFVLAVIASLGGGAAIVGAILHFTIDKIADRIDRRYQLRLDKELETFKSELGKVKEAYKSTLDTKQHISVTRFDAEFEIYKDLSKAFFDAVKGCGVMIPAGFTYSPACNEDRLKEDDENYKVALKSVVGAQDCLHSVAPFIPEEFYLEYRDLLMLLNMQLNAYKRRFNVLDLTPKEEKGCFQPDDYKRTNEINDRFEKLNGKVREYLRGLDVI